MFRKLSLCFQQRGKLAKLQSFVVLDFVHVGINHCNGGYIDDVANRTFKVGEMYRLVQSHLDRAYDFRISIKGLQQLVAAVGTTHIGEYKCVHIQTLQTSERILVVAKLFVQGKVHLHLSIYCQIRVSLLEFFHSSVYLDGTSDFVCSEVGVAYHCNMRLVIEETYCLCRQSCYIHKNVLVRMTIYQCVGEIEDAFLGV